MSPFLVPPVRNRTFSLALTALLAFGTTGAHAELPSALEIVPLDSVDGDSFGVAVAISGNTVIVGAQDRDVHRGAVYIFERHAGGAHVWGQIVSLSGPDLPSWFGTSVALNGDTAAVGMRGGEVVFVLERDAGGPGNWGQVATLTSVDPNVPAAVDERFGMHVAISGDTILTGATLHAEVGFQSGAAYVFERDAGGPGSWGQVAKLLPSDPAEGQRFGTAIALDGDTAVVSARLAEGLGSAGGAYYMFQRDAGGVGNWGQVAKLVSPDPAGEAFFGGSDPALQGDTLMIGALADSSPVPNSGSVYVFQRDPGGSWSQVAQLTPSVAMEGMGFGLHHAIALSGDLALFGAPRADGYTGYEAGAAYLFRREPGDPGSWSQVRKITQPNAAPADRFGYSVAMDGDSAVVGSLTSIYSGWRTSGFAVVISDRFCGDGSLEPPENCDDGNNDPCDGCSPSCEIEVPAICGDGVRDPVCEACDDANTVDGDGCDALCKVEQVQDQFQRKCIVKLNKAFTRVARAHGKHVCRCLRAGFKGDLAASSIESCVQDSGAARVQAAAQKALRVGCGVEPDFGVSDAATFTEVAVRKEVGLVHDIFGPDLDAVILAPGNRKASFRCQLSIAKQAKKCQDVKLKAFTKCKKKALQGKSGPLGIHLPFDTPQDLERCMGFDPKGKIAKACGTKLVRRVTGKCTAKGVDLVEAFGSGTCANAASAGNAAFASCVDARVECRVCRALNTVDRLDRDCDDLDDGILNATCP